MLGGWQGWATRQRAEPPALQLPQRWGFAAYLQHARQPRTAFIQRAAQEALRTYAQAAYVPYDSSDDEVDSEQEVLSKQASSFVEPATVPRLARRVYQDSAKALDTMMASGALIERTRGRPVKTLSDAEWASVVHSRSARRSAPRTPRPPPFAHGLANSLQLLAAPCMGLPELCTPPYVSMLPARHSSVVPRRRHIAPISHLSVWQLATSARLRLLERPELQKLLERLAPRVGVRIDSLPSQRLLLQHSRPRGRPKHANRKLPAQRGARRLGMKVLHDALVSDALQLYARVHGTVQAMEAQHREAAAAAQAPSLVPRRAVDEDACMRPARRWSALPPEQLPVRRPAERIATPPAVGVPAQELSSGAAEAGMEEYRECDAAAESTSAGSAVQPGEGAGVVRSSTHVAAHGEAETPRSTSIALETHTKRCTLREATTPRDLLLRTVHHRMHSQLAEARRRSAVGSSSAGQQSTSSLAPGAIHLLRPKPSGQQCRL
jgi:hypothetical protein